MAAKVSAHLHRAGAFETMHLVHDAFPAKIVSRHEKDILVLRDHISHLEQARVCVLVGCRRLIGSVLSTRTRKCFGIFFDGTPDAPPASYLVHAEIHDHHVLSLFFFYKDAKAIFFYLELNSGRCE